MAQACLNSVNLLLCHYSVLLAPGQDASRVAARFREAHNRQLNASVAAATPTVPSATLPDSFAYNLDSNDMSAINNQRASLPGKGAVPFVKLSIGRELPNTVVLTYFLRRQPLVLVARRL